MITKNINVLHKVDQRGDQLVCRRVEQ